MAFCVGSMLSSGSRDAMIFNHDVRAPAHRVGTLQVREVMWRSPATIWMRACTHGRPEPIVGAGS
jgi:hypothetical protein